MTFTHEQYTEIAQAIFSAYEEVDEIDGWGNDGIREGIDLVKNLFIARHRATNPRFDESKFRWAAESGKDL